MNRDNVLFIVIGSLFGFIAGYVLHEVMAARQPPPRPAGAAVLPSPGADPPPTTAPTGDPTQAMQQVQELRAYVEANPNDREALRQLANMNYDIGNWQRAGELYERLLKLEPDDVDTMTDLGAAYRHQGRTDVALELFRKVKRLAPDHWQSRFNEILVLAFDLGDLQAAAKAAEELRTLQPNNPDVERLAAEVARRLAST